MYPRIICRPARFWQTHGDADPNPVSIMTARKIGGTAGNIHSISPELARAGLMSAERIKVILFQSAGLSDRRGHDD